RLQCWKIRLPKSGNTLSGIRRRSGRSLRSRLSKQRSSLSRKAANSALWRIIVLMSLGDLLFGKPLATYEDCEQRLSPLAGIGVFGLDALSSAAYGPEAALTLLIPLGALGVQYVVPISFSIIALLIIVFISYRQTIAAYPGGGGSYTVARENLGSRIALLAA